MSPFKINYNHVDVNDIMKQIKEQDSIQQRNAMKSFIKTILIQLMRPFRPLIRILIRESYQDLMAETNDRLKHLEQTGGDERTKEYVKLLYGLSHNIVVELTKLKIEVEDLRVKLSILEKDFESFKKRERALERHVFK
ncbi:MAG: hypothetical protein GF421_09925 [Candidatus Aminicenantes bacterium]|nr:hypothetical protein [Candidatus Aminicenantes bacterium]